MFLRRCVIFYLIIVLGGTCTYRNERQQWNGTKCFYDFCHTQWCTKWHVQDSYDRNLKIRILVREQKTVFITEMNVCPNFLYVTDDNAFMLCRLVLYELLKNISKSKLTTIN